MFSGFDVNTGLDNNSYSSLLYDLKSGIVESLTLIPSRREVIVKYFSGVSKTVPILRNDQTILRLAESTDTHLEVKHTSNQDFNSSITASFTLGILFVIFCSILVKKTFKIANKSLSFLSGKASFNEASTIQTRFEDVAGIPEAVEEVKEIVSFLKVPENYRKIGAHIPRGFLLTGPPGTGKTLLAKALAGEAGVPFISTSASQFVELFVGIGAGRIRNLFAQAKNISPCIIFIDEIDAIGRTRGYGIGGGNDEREQTLNQLLIEMDGFPLNSGVVVIAATNREEILDSALTRPGRFDRRINVSLPDRKGREDILSIHGLTKPLSDSVSLKEWAIRTPGFSGADLSNLLNEAAILTARDNQKRIGINQLEAALDRITLGLRRHPINNKHQIRIIAYHEIGKALIAHLTPLADSVDKISILRRSGNISGSTRFVDLDDNKEEGFSSKKYLQNQLLVALGGRAAEILVFGNSEITQISSNQLEQATFIARSMVTQYGFSNLGAISISNNNLDRSLTNELLKTKSIYANKTNKQIDSEISLLINSAQSSAVNIIRPYLFILDMMVDLLIEEEVFTKSRFEDIFDSIYNTQRN